MYSEPFRLFFPVGIFCLLAGALVWLPQIWTADYYPVVLHHYLVLNGFTTCFIGGFLMTAVPRFSKTWHANKGEVWTLLILVLIGIIPATLDFERGIFGVSFLQAITILVFIFRRIVKRQENPPYSFLFIFVGLFLWIISSLGGFLSDAETFEELHYEGALAAIILGVGSRLIPGILGHVEIVGKQRQIYELPVPLLKTVPKYFFIIILAFVGSYFLPEVAGSIARAIVVSFIGYYYWRLFKAPISRTSLTWSIWIGGHFIVLSFLLRVFWPEGMIHASHAFFIGGIVLLCLLIATRVIQSHGPKNPELENWKGLYWVTGLILFAAATRVSAILLPESYLRHLGYGSFLLVTGVTIWSWKYLRYVRLNQT